MPRTTTRQSVTLTLPQFAALKAESARLGISVADLVRRIVDMWREKRAEESR